MSKAVIRKATYEDKYAVSNFLSKNNLNNYKFNNEIFEIEWNDNKNYGFIIEDKNKIRGFIGGFYSQINFSFGLSNYINMTSWCVETNYRNLGLQLLEKFLDCKNCVFTNFSASVDVEKILPRYSFDRFNKYEIIIPLYSGFFSKINKSSTKISLVKDKQLSNNYIAIYLQNHQKYGCKLIKIKNKDKEVYLIVSLKKILRNKLNCVQIVFSNDYNFLLENIFDLNYWFLKKYKSFFVSLSSHNFDKFEKKFHFFKRDSKKYILNNNSYNLIESDYRKISLLYSEIILHNYFY